MTSAAHEWLKDSLVLIMTMRQDDAASWDPEALVRLAQSFHVNTVGFSVGGITAFYPTRIPHHPRSPSLADRDVVGETVAALRRANLRVLGRIDPSLAAEALYREQPGWFAATREGEPIRIHGHYLTCPSGGYYRDFMLKVVAEIVGAYPLDGLWANAAQHSPWHAPRCFCENCRLQFREYAGAELPLQEDWNDPAWRQYNEWRYRSIADWNRLVHDTIQRTRASCAWLPLSQVGESWDHARRGGWDTDYIEPHTDGLVVEAQRRYPNLWWPGMESRYLHSLNRQKPAGATVSYFYPWWRFYHAPVAENRAWTAQMISNGVRPWLHLTGYFSAHFDRRGLDQFRQLFARIAAHPDAFSGTQSCAEVAVVYSRRTLDNHGGANPVTSYLGSFRGAYNALLSERIPFDVLSDHRLDRLDLQRYRCILLPNTVCLCDAATESVLAYVRKGGQLVVTGDTARLDEQGNERARNPLMEAAGFERSGADLRDLKAAYASLCEPGHRLLHGIVDTNVLPVTGSVMVTRSTSARAPVMALIKPIESEPGSGISVPEFNAVPAVSDVPLLHEAVVGQGAIVWFPWEPERIGYEFGFRDCFTLLANAVRAAPGYVAQVAVGGKGFVDVSLMRGDGRLVLHLVNLSGSGGGIHAGQRRAVEEIMPVHDLLIRLRLPEGARAARAHWVSSGAPLTPEPDSGWIEVTLDRLEDFDSLVVHVE
jgi:hypothetical protein